MFMASGVETGDEGRAVATPLPPLSGDQAIASIASHSLIRGATKGAFGSRTGKAGLPGIDTLVGSIQGRTHAGGMGLLSLTALTFATMKDARAADANVTILDEDSIAYKDLEYGVFELVTKEAIPRYVIVGDPGETIVLNRSGSSISVSQFANSAARMEELQAAQREVYANLTQGVGPPGSSTPSFIAPSLLQPINFTQPADPTAQDSLPTLPAIQTTIESGFVRAPDAPPPPTLTLTLDAGPLEADTFVFDTFAATSGVFTASSSNGAATLTYGISGGSPGNTVLDGVTYNVSQAGRYGTLYINSATGAYTFVPDDAAINALKAPTTESFVVTVSDGTLSANQAFTVDIAGVNDDAIIAGDVTGSLSEASSIASAARFAVAHAQAPRVATGTLTSTDVDDAQNTFAAVDSPTASNGGYGTFTMTADGLWIYTLDDGNSAVQALNVGDRLIDTFTVATVDGTPQVVTIIIAGRNDAAVISGDTAGSVVEAACGRPGIPTATGTLTDTDVDNAQNTFTPVQCERSDGGYGTFTMTADGVWAYTLDNDNCAVQALNVCDKLTDTFTVTTVDGTEQVVTIIIAGRNDAAIISGDTAGSVVEAACGRPGMPTTTGTLTDTDVDNAQNAFTPVQCRESDGGYGTFTMTADGVWTYKLDNDNCKVQALNVCDKLTDTFTVTTVDGTEQVVRITIAGNNDAAIISGTTTGTVVEAACGRPGIPTATGTLTDTDVDNAQNTFTPVQCRESDGGYGIFTMTADGVWTYTLDNDNCKVQALDDCDRLTDTFTVTTVDGTEQVVRVTIQGIDDEHGTHETAHWAAWHGGHDLMV
jgi:VCBS repeat-containing protein